jgi:hypothetical protein
MVDDLGPDLGAAVDAARVDAFVGRSAELAAFEQALRGPGTPRVFYVSGPGGIGKTTLLHRFRIAARRAGRTVAVLDAREIDGTPDGFRSAWQARGPCSVLLVDGYDRLLAIEDWFRDEFLSRLPPDSVVALAGREPPATPWRIDPGWRTLARSLPLTPLSTKDSIELLDRVGVPAARRDAMVTRSRGHPLTLALLAEAVTTGGGLDDLADAPDLVSALAVTLVGRLTDERQELACGLCALAWLTTRPMLESASGERTGELWAWLSTRPFINRGPDGIYPHELVRDVLEADLRHRSPEHYRRIHGLIHQHAITQLRAADPGQRMLWSGQLVYLHRRSPFAAALGVLRNRGTVAVVPGAEADRREVVDLVGRVEGPTSSELARRWLSVQPENLSVIGAGDGSGRVEGFLVEVLVPPEIPCGDPMLALLADDPVLGAVGAVTSSAPARPGELVSVARFLGGREGQRDPHAVLVCATASTVRWMTAPLAWSFVVTHDPEYWAPTFDYLGFTERARVGCDGRSYTVFGHDWRRLPPERWIDVMIERELSGRGGPFPESMLRSPPLSRDAFDDAVRAALRTLSAPDLLRRNPLADSRLTLGAQTDDPVRALRATLVAGIGRLAHAPATAQSARVLDRTFVRAAPTQEAAAAVLDLPFSTYRRHLAKATAALTDLLWAVEVGEVRLTADG